MAGTRWRLVSLEGFGSDVDAGIERSASLEFTAEDSYVIVDDGCNEMWIEIAGDSDSIDVVEFGETTVVDCELLGDFNLMRLFGSNQVLYTSDSESLEIVGGAVVARFDTVAPAEPGEHEPVESIDPGVGLDGPVMRHQQRPIESGEVATGDISGVLEVERDCLYLTNIQTGERLSVVWPAGTMWDPDRMAVGLPSGELVNIGDEVLGGGSYTNVGAVGQVAGAEALAVAEFCVDPGTNQVGIISNFDDAIGPR